MPISYDVKSCKHMVKGCTAGLLHNVTFTNIITRSGGVSSTPLPRGTQIYSFPNVSKNPALRAGFLFYRFTIYILTLKIALWHFKTTIRQKVK